jgi:hypothetical protein
MRRGFLDPGSRWLETGASCLPGLESLGKGGCGGICRSRVKSPSFPLFQRGMLIEELMLDGK